MAEEKSRQRNSHHLNLGTPTGFRRPSGIWCGEQEVRLCCLRRCHQRKGAQEQQEQIDGYVCRRKSPCEWLILKSARGDLRSRNYALPLRSSLSHLMIDSMVGAEGFEPPTLCSQSRCATRLRYAPILRIVSQPASVRRGGASHSRNQRIRKIGARKMAARVHGNQHQEDPVSPGLPPRLLQMANDQRIVAPVRLPRDVKGIAQQRNRAQQHLDARC